MTAITFIDAHVHANSRSYEDFERLFTVGCEGLVVVAGPEGGFKGPDSVLDHFRRLFKVDIDRVVQAGLKCYLALGIHPVGIPDKDLDKLLRKLPKVLSDYRAVALGEVGLEKIDSKQEYALSSQLEIAAKLGLPVILHTPRKNKKRITERILKILSDSSLDPGRVMLDHLDKEVASEVLGFGGWLGLSVHPTKLRPVDAADLVKQYGSLRFILDTDMGANPSYLFGIPAAMSAMADLEVDEETIRAVARDNLRAFLGLDN